jgi:benzoyl-CoA reductase/2-hydroxyglutaryl-CoA dehydratase subunit BcrC/BadD/HgdB
MSGDERQTRMTGQVRTRHYEEVNQALSDLRGRPDYFPELEYFLELISGGMSGAADRTGRPIAALLCLQAPLELIHAYGFQPYKIFGGAVAPIRLSSPSLPVIMCPMLRSALGELMLADPDNRLPVSIWIAPSTCDWSVKFASMVEHCGCSLDAPIRRLELPHQKDDPISQERWREEIMGLGDFLRTRSGVKKPPVKGLLKSMALYGKAWQALSRLRELKKTGYVSAVWSQAIHNTFFHDSIETWTARLNEATVKFSENPPLKCGQPVFLAGSPIFFPNLKILNLLEEADLTAVIDDLCSSERLFPGFVPYDEPVWPALIKALAQRYHQGCLCPTFTDNDRRINNITSPAHKSLVKGVIYHVLKGCHPFDLESLTLEKLIKAEGLRYLRVETDYTAEDSQNILTRLEAFRASMI